MQDVPSMIYVVEMPHYQLPTVGVHRIGFPGRSGADADFLG